VVLSKADLDVICPAAVFWDLWENLDDLTGGHRVEYLTELFNEPFPVRRFLRKCVAQFGLGNYQFRYKIGAVHRRNYAYLVYQAAQLARWLGEPRISVIEFGVAGGAGLLALEYHAREIEKLFGVEIEIYGFDTGAGLPSPEDYRDLPYHWKPGFFRMDVPALQSRIRKAKLVIGDIRDTIHSFVANYHPAPIAAISYDMDFYSSTIAAFKLFEFDAKSLFPRIFVYFDDVQGGNLELYNDFSGERLAIH
jgi:hypothetical protein